jgi:nucleotide-binding universal stress UspA family protein
MMPTLGYTRFRALLLGSVTSSVLHDAACPVWTARHAEAATAPQTYSSVVCAVDLNENTVNVLKFAGEFARSWNARLHVVHSVPAVDERFYSAAAARAHRYLCDSAARDYPALAAEAGIDAPLNVLEGPGLANSVNEAAAARQADLLIIGRGVVQGVLGRLRTNAHELIRTAPCPVLSV